MRLKESPYVMSGETVAVYCPLIHDGSIEVMK